jgi:hypothetical protein
MVPKITPLNLQFEYFGAGPGMGGISELSIKQSKSKISVRYRTDLTDPDEKSIVVARLSSARNWRDLIGTVLKRESYAYFTDGDTSVEYPWPHLMRFEGPANYATELIACAWAGPRASEIADAFSLASDEQLSMLREKVGSLKGARFVRRALRLIDEVDEIPTNLSLSEFVRRSRAEPINLSAMRRDICAIARVIDIECRSAEDRHDWEIAPFKNDITRIVEAWRRSLKLSSPRLIGGITLNLRVYLENYVKERHALPNEKRELFRLASSFPGKDSVDLKKFADLL